MEEENAPGDGVDYAAGQSSRLEAQDAGMAEPSIAEAAEADAGSSSSRNDVLYYVDADGNRIDPDDMQDYSVVADQQEVEENTGQFGALAKGTEEQSSIMQMDMDVDQSAMNTPPEQSATVSSVQKDGPDHHSVLLAGAPNSEEEEAHDEDMAGAKAQADEADEEDRSRYARPYRPPRNVTSAAAIAEEGEDAAAKTPNYAARWTITGHRKNVSCIQFSPNGEWLITAGADGRVLLYSLPKASNLRIEGPMFIRSYTIPTPPVVKISTRNPSASSKNLGGVVGSNGINDLCFSPDSRYFATASDDKIVRIFKVDPFPEGSTLGAGQMDDRIEGLDDSMKGTNNGSRDAHTVAGAANGEMQEEEEEPEYIGHTTSGEPVLPSSALSKAHIKPIILKGHTSFVSCVAFTPQGNLLASGSYDETIRIWDVKRGTLLRSLPAHADPVAAVGFSGDGSVLCSAGHDGLLRLWDTATGQCLKSLVDESNPPASHAVFTPNSRYILVSSLDSTIRLWDYHAAVCVKTYTGHKNVKYSIHAIFAQPPKGKAGPTYIVTGSEDGRVIFYDLQSRNIAFDLPGHKESPMLCLAVRVSSQASFKSDSFRIRLTCQISQYHQQSGMLATCALERGVKEHTVKLWIDKNRYPREATGANGHSNGH